MKRWIDHPGCTEPVWLHRWLVFQIGEWLYGLSGRLKHRANCMQHWAVYGTYYDDDIPF